MLEGIWFRRITSSPLQNLNLEIDLLRLLLMTTCMMTISITYYRTSKGRKHVGRYNNKMKLHFWVYLIKKYNGVLRKSWEYSSYDVPTHTYIQQISLSVFSTWIRWRLEVKDYTEEENKYSKQIGTSFQSLWINYFKWVFIFVKSYFPMT